jgi:hypothetical protein
MNIVSGGRTCSAGTFSSAHKGVRQNKLINRKPLTGFRNVFVKVRMDDLSVDNLEVREKPSPVSF